MNLLTSLHSFFKMGRAGGQEEVEATGLEADLEVVKLEETSGGGGQYYEQEEDEKDHEEEGHEEGEEGHEEGVGLDDEGVGWQVCFRIHILTPI
jgi:hypothetical protein